MSDVKIKDWMMRRWKPATALVYTFICLCDFVFFPMYVGLSRQDLIVLANEMAHLDIQVQRDLIVAATRPYEPFTLMGAGMFHLAFGAILTGSALSKKPDTGDEPVVVTQEQPEYTSRGW